MLRCVSLGLVLSGLVIVEDFQYCAEHVFFIVLLVFLPGGSRIVPDRLFESSRGGLGVEYVPQDVVTSGLFACLAYQFFEIKITFICIKYHIC